MENDLEKYFLDFILKNTNSQLRKGYYCVWKSEQQGANAESRVLMVAKQLLVS